MSANPGSLMSAGNPYDWLPAEWWVGSGADGDGVQATMADFQQLNRLVPDWPKLARRLVEIGLHPAKPWIWMQTIHPISGQTDTVIRIITRLPEENTRLVIRADKGLLIQKDLSVSPESTGFGPKWTGYHYEAIGFLRYYNHDGDYFIMEDNRPGQPPMWNAFMQGGENPTMIAALWLQRAYRLTKSGSEPPLITELRWWPGQIGPQPFIRVTLPSNQTPSRKHWDAAEEARQLLLDREQRASRTGMSDDDAFEEAVGFMIAWLNNHPGEQPRDFGYPELTAQRCTGPDATTKWLKSKHFSIKRVRQEVRRRLQLPT